MSFSGQDPNEPPRDKRSSFSFSSGFSSLKRAVSKGKKSDQGTDQRTDQRNEKDKEAAAESLNASNPFADPPPAYTITAPEESGESTEQDPPGPLPPARAMSLYTRLRSAQDTDKLRFLAEFDTVFLIDDSGSMTLNDRGSQSIARGELTRWAQTRSIIEQIVPICMRYDQDGIDLYFLNDASHQHMFDDPGAGQPTWRPAGNKAEGKAGYAYLGIGNADDVRRLFNSRQPNYGTPTGARLGDMMQTYVNCYEKRASKGQTPPKPLNIIVITDGAAGDKDTLRNNLIAQAERLDRLSAPYHQLGVQFFQVGKDESAAKYLHELDDGLVNYRRGKELRDIVDCVTYEQIEKEGGAAELTADMILKVVLGAVNRHLDHQRIREGRLVVPTA
ncbi:hypothetical protein F5Y14DRAFT_403278 [Nemania sp. NC0429]|nr:hypothetical protein F5Y14DRAFT_403278 [Nemania sp. NC0429]